MRRMYDSVTPENIPDGAQLVAGYVDGRYANLDAMAARFPQATIVRIATSWHTRAQVLDVEAGDATPDEAVMWCRSTMSDTPNSQLTVYCNAASWHDVRAEFWAAHEQEPQYWLAQWDGSAAIPAGAVAKQYYSYPGFDISSVVGYWPGVDELRPLWYGRTPFHLTDPMMTSEYIRQWQQKMANRGWTIDADGVYGPQSESVCRQFQAEKGLYQDGVVGQQTWDATWSTPVTH